MGANWGFDYNGENYSFVDITSVTDYIFPHGQDLEKKGCNGGGSPTDSENNQKGNFDVLGRGLTADFVEWKESIARYNVASLQAMTIENYNGVEAYWTFIIDALTELKDSLEEARGHILLYKDEFWGRDRVCEGQGWWRNIRDANRNFRNDVNAEILSATKLRQYAINLETGVTPDFGGDVKGCTDVNSKNYNPLATSSDGTCGDKSSAELNLILAGKVVLGIVGIFIGYKLFKKFKK